jgi:hypothetical protein
MFSISLRRSNRFTFLSLALVSASLSLGAQQRATRVQSGPPSSPTETRSAPPQGMTRGQYGGSVSRGDATESSRGEIGMNPSPSRRVTKAPNGAPIRVLPVRATSGSQQGRPIVLPIAMTRWIGSPSADRWGSRDITQEIRAMARHGAVPIKAIGDLSELDDYSWVPAGWRGYGMVVPPRGEVKVSLEHPNRGWFRVAMCNKWGNLEVGMLQNVVHTFEPVVTYKNPTDKARPIYIQRNWDPSKEPTEPLKLVEGIWAVHKFVEPSVNLASR